MFSFLWKVIMLLGIQAAIMITCQKWTVQDYLVVNNLVFV
jgi:hypothetical protein